MGGLAEAAGLPPQARILDNRVKLGIAKAAYEE
jgi:hypothetical protein